MSTYLSNKLYFFSFWLIVLVVFLHSLNINPKTCEEFNCFLQYFFAHKITQIAVPLFFTITGYLYFLKINESAVSKNQFFINNTKKRFKTILIPFTIWCLFWYAFLFVLQQLPFLSPFFSQPLHQMSFSDQLINIFITPINYPFWFLRDLVLLFIFSPLIYISIKYLNFVAVLIYFTLSIFYNSIITINDAGVFLFLPLFYFSLGAYLSIYKVNLIFELSKWFVITILLIWIALNILSVYTEFNNLIPSQLKVLNLFKDLIGCLAIWSLYDLCNQKKQWKNYSFYKYSFFIFAIHGVPTFLLVQLIQRLIINQVLLLIIFFVTPIFIILMSIFLASVIKNNIPKFYLLLTGSR